VSSVQISPKQNIGLVTSASLTACYSVLFTEVIRFKTDNLVILRIELMGEEAPQKGRGFSSGILKRAPDIDVYQDHVL